MLTRLSTALAALFFATAAVAATAPSIVETRTVALTQTVTLKNIPVGARNVKMWVPIPSDSTYQRVLDREVVSAPGEWRVVRQSEGRGDFVVVNLKSPKSQEAAVVVSSVVQRQGVQFQPDSLKASGPIQRELFTDSLDTNATFMLADAKVKAMADKAVGVETDMGKQALLLLAAVADSEDHYSKNPAVPKCGRGSAQDCMEHGGGCCTDLHSLFIAMARYKGIPARIQYGFRDIDSKAGAPYDPSYRCWVEFFVPGSGWVPTDIVAADAAPADHPAKYASLSATRVWLWSGRDFELTPKAAAGKIPTMTVGWAEIDGKPVDPLPAADGTPSKLTRTVEFQIVSDDRNASDTRLPE